MVGSKVLFSAIALGAATLPSSAQVPRTELVYSMPWTAQSVQPAPLDSFRPRFELAPASYIPAASTLLLVRRDPAQRMTAPSAPSGDGWQKVLIALALVAYQLRRKHRSLRTQPFGL